MYSKFLGMEKEKRERILNAALKEFADNGYEKARTNEIVKQAGISKGLLYHYFDSKKNLFLFLYDYTTQIFIEEFFGLINLKERDVLARWRQHSLLKLDLIQKYPEMFHFIVTANQEQSEEIKNETESKNKDIYTDGYTKIFENIDQTKFKDDVDIKKALNVIKWTMEGFSNLEQQKLETSNLNKMDYDKMLRELDSYFEMLKKCFYK
jgi:AcrR family transcriptional regulator